MFRIRKFLPIAAALIACSDPKPPASCGTLPQISVFVGETETAKPCFTDPEGGALSMTATSRNPDVATATMVQDELRVTGVWPGRTEATVTALDPDSLTGTVYVAVVVPNRPPVGQLDDVEVRRGVARTIELAPHFSDPDGQTLTYTASSAAQSVGTAGISGSTLTVTPVAREGSAEIAVVASDGGMDVTAPFEAVIVYPAGVTVSPGSAELDYLETVALSVAVTDQNGKEMPEEAVEWSSEDAGVATVSGEGLVTGRGVGNTRIVATADEATGSAAITGVLGERGALARIYESLNGDDWTNNDNWLTTESLDSWHGVETNDDGTVLSLSLGSNNLAGTIPPEVEILDRMTIFSMFENRIEGSIPAELGQMERLLSIVLYDNQLTGSIPAELGQLDQLTVLTLHKNRLTGSIPAELGNTDLLHLQLYENNLTGPVPSSIGNLDGLSSLGIDSNNLSGALPQSMTNLDALFLFYWNNNTDLCSPPNDEFQDWLDRIVLHRGGEKCSED